MDGEKVMEVLLPMREVANYLETAALDGGMVSAKSLLDMAQKLTAVELAIMDEYNRELSEEHDRLEAERAELLAPARWAARKEAEING